MSNCDDFNINNIETSCVIAAANPCATTDANCACVTQAALSSKVEVCVNNANLSYGSDCWTNSVDEFCATVVVTRQTSPAAPTSTTSTPILISTPTSIAPAATPLSTTFTPAARTTSTTATSTISTLTTSQTSTFTSTHTETSATSSTSSTSTSPISSPSVIPISTAAFSSDTSSSSSTHAPIPAYNGAGDLLVGYCATPEYTMLDGPTALWAPIVGCVGDKPDCCPFTVVTSTTNDIVTATATQGTTVTIDVGASDSSQSNGLDDFPQPTNTTPQTLARCPDDYQTVGDGCCPSGYLLWNAQLGGQTPCYSTLENPLTPPPVTVNHPHPTDAITSYKPTSAVVNVVYEMHYPSKPTSTPAMPANTKIGIGAGSGAAAIAIGALAALLLLRNSKHKKEKKALQKERDSIARYSLPSQMTHNDSVETWRQSMPPPPLPVHQYPSMRTQHSQGGYYPAAPPQQQMYPPQVWNGMQQADPRGPSIQSVPQSNTAPQFVSGMEQDVSRPQQGQQYPTMVHSTPSPPPATQMDLPVGAQGMSAERPLQDFQRA